MLAVRRASVNRAYSRPATLYFIYIAPVANGNDGYKPRIMIHMVQHPVIAHPEAAQMVQAVPQRLAKSQRISRQPGFDRFADAPPDSRVQPRDIFTDDAVRIAQLPHLLLPSVFVAYPFFTGGEPGIAMSGKQRILMQFQRLADRIRRCRRDGAASRPARLESRILVSSSSMTWILGLSVAIVTPPPAQRLVCH